MATGFGLTQISLTYLNWPTHQNLHLLQESLYLTYKLSYSRLSLHRPSLPAPHHFFGETGRHALTVFTFPDPCHSFAVRIRLNNNPNLTPNPIRTHDCAPNPNRQNYDMGLET